MGKSVVEKLAKFLSKELREQAEKKDKLRKILAKMRKKQKKLEHELTLTADPEEQAKLNKKIRLLKEQRKKGIACLETLQHGEEG